MLRGATGPVAVAALTEGAEAVRGVRARGRPAGPADAGLDRTRRRRGYDKLGPAGEVCVDTKLDGIRVQVHKQGDQVWVFTRSLDDVTARLTEVVAVARSLPVESAILDGEAIALDEPGGRGRSRRRHR